MCILILICLFRKLLITKLKDNKSLNKNIFKVRTFCFVVVEKLFSGIVNELQNNTLLILGPFKLGNPLL